MSEVLPFPETPTRKQLAWGFARTIWGRRPDFPHGRQYAQIVRKLASCFTAEQIQAEQRRAIKLLHPR